ncbi:phosphatase PAP2 family protein [Candidatus Vallotia cooleyia]|uniref:phosphatase PAP2 family protein n=1 Tax=Candidatus Vallotiella adelgis TaxID=1177211 RepID=UPI001D01E38A|nr:phosphatase PAP2 family protein [Candidatus Vallotia cooleyia]
MLPVAAAIALWLIVGRTWRSAIAWSGLLMIGIALVIVTKIAFLGWGVGIRSLDFTGISGHSMLATAVLPAAVFLGTRSVPVVLRLTMLIVGLVASAIISVSRLAVDAHSVSEVIAGFALGAAVSLGWIIWAAPNKLNVTAPVSRWLVAVSLIGLTISLHGYHARTHRWVTQIAVYLSGHDRPFVRARWKAHQAPILSQTRYLK